VARKTIEKLFGVRASEVGPALLCALCYFLVLFAWFIIRPVRDQVGLAGGVRNLNWLFLATLGVTLAATPVYGALAQSLSRGRFIASVYLIFVCTLAIFGFAFYTADDAAQIWIGRGFYIWASVLNLFLIAVFTALMVDVWSLDGSRRVFGLIAMGGTLGAIAGSALTSILAARVETTGLLAVSCAIFLIAATLMVWVQRRFARARSAPVEKMSPLSLAAASDGVWLVLKSPYLLGICAFMLCLTVLSSFLYFEKMRIVELAIESGPERRTLFAQINLGTQSLTLLAQIFLTAHSLRRLGVAITLFFMPLVTFLGFFSLALAPVLAVIVVFEVVRGASNYAFTKPARETLFTVLSKGEKYKAKGFIDTFVYRSGDALGALSDKAVTTWIAPGAVPWVAMGIAGIWGAVAVFLGIQQRRFAGRQPDVHPDPDSPVQSQAASVIAASPAGVRP
jgi:AAA family ATP:ADP antiporter